MIAENLKWDSDFFGRTISKVVISREADPEVVSNACAHALQIHEESTCYLYSDQNEIPAIINRIAKLGINVHPFGSIVLYRKTDTSLNEGTAGIGVVRLHKPDQETFNLACESGICSRFNKDPVFRPKFRALYEQWINNAFCQPNEVAFGVMTSGHLSGLISFSTAFPTASISLLSVSRHCRRKGIGRKLVATFEAESHRCGCRELTVKTQGENLPARNLYEHSGFVPVKETWIWHAHWNHSKRF